MVYMQTLSEKPGIPIPRKDEIVTTAVFPNPATDHLEVICRDLLEAPFTVSLYDISGRTVKMERFENRHFILKLDNVPQGLYIFRLLDGDGVQVTTQKILVLRH